MPAKRTNQNTNQTPDKKQKVEDKLDLEQEAFEQTAYNENTYDENDEQTNMNETILEETDADVEKPDDIPQNWPKLVGIKDLKPKEKDDDKDDIIHLTIKGRIIYKSQLKTWRHENIEHKIINLTVRDEDGEIDISGFDERAILFQTSTLILFYQVVKLFKMLVLNMS